MARWTLINPPASQSNHLPSQSDFLGARVGLVTGESGMVMDLADKLNTRAVRWLVGSVLLCLSAASMAVDLYLKDYKVYRGLIDGDAVTDIYLYSAPR